MDTGDYFICNLKDAGLVFHADAKTQAIISIIDKTVNLKKSDTGRDGKESK